MPLFTFLLECCGLVVAQIVSFTRRSSKEDHKNHHGAVEKLSSE